MEGVLSEEELKHPQYASGNFHGKDIFFLENLNPATEYSFLLMADKEGMTLFIIVPDFL